ncbi:MAG: hypothetical protein MHMPM18_002802 [Marteilia pararefringens]
MANSQEFALKFLEQYYGLYRNETSRLECKNFYAPNAVMKYTDQVYQGIDAIAEKLLELAKAGNFEIKNLDMNSNFVAHEGMQVCEIITKSYMKIAGDEQGHFTINHMFRVNEQSKIIAEEFIFVYD